MNGADIHRKKKGLLVPTRASMLVSGMMWVCPHSKVRKVQRSENWNRVVLTGLTFEGRSGK